MSPHLSKYKDSMLKAKCLPYSTNNAQLTDEPLEQPNYAEKNSAQRYKF